MMEQPKEGTSQSVVWINLYIHAVRTSNCMYRTHFWRYTMVFVDETVLIFQTAPIEHAAVQGGGIQRNDQQSTKVI